MISEDLPDSADEWKFREQNRYCPVCNVIELEADYWICTECWNAYDPYVDLIEPWRGKHEIESLISKIREATSLLALEEVVYDR